MTFAFDTFVVYPAAREVRRSGETVPVEPKVFDLLILLIEERDRVVSKDELVASIWQGRFISDAAISSAVSAARRAIGDDGRAQRYLRTVHGRGFRFVGPVVEVGPKASEAPDVPPKLSSEEEFDTHGAAPPTEPPKPGAGMSAAHGRRRIWPTVTVIPLHATGEEPGTSEVASLLTDDLAACLSRDRSLAVIAEGSVLFEGRDIDVRRAANRMGVHYLVDGRVRRVEGSLIVTVRLIDCADWRNAWVERYAQRLDGRLTLDEDLTSKVAAAIRSEIEACEARRAELAGPESLDFRAEYFMGSREMYRFTPAGLASAQAHFERAIQLDPTSAAAHARVAYVQIQLYWYGSPVTRETALQRAMFAANEAVALDQKCALGHLSLGRALALRRRFDEAIPELEAAIRLDPSLAQALFALGQACGHAGRAKDAVRSLDAAVELNPYDPHLWSFLHDRSEAQFALGAFASAERDARAAARAPNATHWPWVTLTAVLGAAGKRDEARDALRELLTRRPDYGLSIARNDLSHFSDASFAEMYIEGLTQAGLTAPA